MVNPSKAITSRQQGVLELLNNLKVASPSWCDRSVFEALVRKGLAIKHFNGRQVTYSLTTYGQLTITKRVK